MWEYRLGVQTTCCRGCVCGRFCGSGRCCCLCCSASSYHFQRWTTTTQALQSHWNPQHELSSDIASLGQPASAEWLMHDPSEIQMSVETSKDLRPVLVKPVDSVPREWMLRGSWQSTNTEDIVLGSRPTAGAVEAVIPFPSWMEGDPQLEDKACRATIVLARS